MIYRDGNTQSAIPVSSIRFELLHEGIQDYEKISILADPKLNNAYKGLRQLPEGMLKN